MDYKVSVLQYKPELFEVEKNFNRLYGMISACESDLIVLPELALSGYLFSSIEEVKSVSESVPEGKVFKGFKSLAAVKNTSIVYGFAEQSQSRYFNSCALINPDGSFYVYRKIHLFDREKLFFTPGDRPFEVCKAKKDVVVGLMICFDWQFPEAARSLSLRGAEILCHPSNLVLPWCQEAMKTRSLENRVYSITSNRTGSDYNGDLNVSFTGKSQILGVKGDILVRLNDSEEGVYTIGIDPSLARDKTVTERNNAFEDRRLEMYHLHG